MTDEIYRDMPKSSSREIVWLSTDEANAIKAENTQLRQQISHLKSQMEYLRQVINNALEEG